MTHSVRRQFDPTARTLFARVDASGGGPSAASLTPLERRADAAAADWQIILHLRSLFESDPSLISTLLEDVGDDAPAGYVETLMVAAGEALAETPNSVDLHWRLAMAAARHGRTDEAESLLHSLLEINPGHAAALALLPGLAAAPATPGNIANLGRPAAEPPGALRRGH